MNYKTLADTHIPIPEIGLGTWQYTGGVGPLRRGIELGATLIDTAEAYRTEDVVGQAIQGMRDRVFIATKVSPSHFRRNDLLRAADQSLRLLKTDYIDLYQLHWPSPNIPIAETMGAMEELVQAGKIRYIGVSNFSVLEMEEAQDALRTEKIASNQVLYHLAERDIEEDLIRYCQQRKITILA
jgi:diketogulonate reductase-like aldo/keto reductase